MFQILYYLINEMKIVSNYFNNNYVLILLLKQELDQN